MSTDEKFSWFTERVVGDRLEVLGFHSEAAARAQRDAWRAEGSESVNYWPRPAMTTQPSPDPLSPALREEIDGASRDVFQNPTLEHIREHMERIARAAVREERERFSSLQRYSIRTCECVNCNGAPVPEEDDDGAYIKFSHIERLLTR